MSDSGPTAGTTDVSMQIRIAAAHPSLHGHFPGNPVVPGALLLAELEERLASAGIRVVAVRRARFMQMLRPTEAADVSCRMGSNGELRFDCRVGDRVIARGSFAVESDER